MAISIADFFDEAATTCMKSFFGTLSEKDQRRYAAIEARRLGHGGITFVSGILGCSIRTIRRGMDELDTLENDPAAGRVRRPGAGRKKASRPTPKSSKT